MSTNRLLVLFTAITLLSKVVHSQDACERITTGDLGASTMLSGTGLIADILSPAGQGSTIVSVRVLNINIVCEAQHMMKNRYRYTSVVVSFNCFTADSRVPECMDNTVVLTEQFDLGCSGGQWTQAILTLTNSARTANPIANLTTELDTGCRLCINPNHTAGGPSVDMVAHCLGCTDCKMGLQRCYVDENSNEVCCNYFNEGICVIECPNPLVPGAEFDCECTLLSDANGQFMYTSGQSIGSIANFTCNAGFALNGTSTVTCEGSGWTGMPTCDPIECEPLSSIVDGFITYAPDNLSNYALGTVATYACDAGFALSMSGGGSEMRTCVDDSDGDALGVFDGQAPVCVPIECESLPSIANGSLTYVPDSTPNYVLETVAIYACDVGFIMDPSISGMRTCVDDGDGDALGMFDGQASVCVPIECEPLPSIDNGVIAYAPDTTSNYTLNTIATYACDVGFILDLSVGSEMRVCIDDSDGDAFGIFDGQTPTCIPIECEPLPSIAAGSITYTPDNLSNYTLGTVATYACDAGFALDVSGGGSETRTCIDDGDGDVLGVFNGQEPSCISTECEPVPSIAAGSIMYAPDSTPNYALGTVATYACDAGFVMEPSGGGSETRTCIDDGDGNVFGEFDGQAPVCVPIECEPLSLIADGSITYAPDNSPNYALETVATYACDAGFALNVSDDGSEMRTCIDNGDGDALGVFDGQAPVCVAVCGDVIDNCVTCSVNGNTCFHCSADYILMGGACVPIECSVLMETYGDFGYTNAQMSGSVATLTCDTGFEVSGTNPVTCKNTGEWSGMPTCQPVCGVLISGCVICSARGENGTCTGCSPEFTLTNGICERIDCGIISVDNGNLAYTNDQVIGSAATLTCDPGFVVSGTNPVTCQATGEWTGRLACEPVCGDLISNCITCSVRGQNMTCTECSSNYELMGSNCIPIECEELSETNGKFQYTDGQIFGSVATLTCDPGFEVSGTNPVTCQISREWTEVPKCQPLSNFQCDTGCIVGLSVLGVVLLILVVGLFIAIIGLVVHSHKQSKSEKTLDKAEKDNSIKLEQFEKDDVLY